MIATNRKPTLHILLLVLTLEIQDLLHPLPSPPKKPNTHIKKLPLVWFVNDINLVSVSVHKSCIAYPAQALPYMRHFICLVTNVLCLNKQELRGS